LIAESRRGTRARRLAESASPVDHGERISGSR
jgi:hypothetical protein